MGRIYVLLVGEIVYTIACKPLVLCDTHGNELRLIHLTTGAPHDVNPSLINLPGLLCVHIWGGFTHFSLNNSYIGFYSL